MTEIESIYGKVEIFLEEHPTTKIGTRMGQVMAWSLIVGLVAFIAMFFKFVFSVLVVLSFIVFILAAKKAKYLGSILKAHLIAKFGMQTLEKLRNADFGHDKKANQIIEKLFPILDNERI